LFLVRLMKRKLKMEIVLAIMMTAVISLFTVYVNSQSRVIGGSNRASTMKAEYGSYGMAMVQQVVWEDIQGDLRKGSFETVVEGLRNVTFHYAGSVPYLNMLYENELWSGKLNCNVPTENVASYTFKVRQLISENGKVTHISISTTETKVNQTVEQVSTVSIGLKETGNIESPIVNQVGAVVPWLVTSLVWIAEGLIIGVPLCFVSLGIVMMIDRGIVPAWRRQFKGRNVVKATVTEKKKEPNSDSKSRSDES